MTVIEAIDQLDEEFAELDPSVTLTVEQGRELLLCCKRLALWCRALSRQIDQVDEGVSAVARGLQATERFVGAPQP